MYDPYLFSSRLDEICAERDEARILWCLEHEAYCIEEMGYDPWEKIRKSDEDEADRDVIETLFIEKWGCEMPQDVYEEVVNVPETKALRRIRRMKD